MLTRKKMYSNQLRSVQGMNMTMGQTAMTIENMQMMKDQYNIMKEVSDAQSQMFKTVNMNEFLRLSDKMQDMREDMDDVQEMCTSSRCLSAACGSACSAYGGDSCSGHGFQYERFEQLVMCAVCCREGELVDC